MAEHMSESPALSLGKTRSQEDRDECMLEGYGPPRVPDKVPSDHWRGDNNTCQPEPPEQKKQEWEVLLLFCKEHHTLLTPGPVDGSLLTDTCERTLPYPPYPRHRQEGYKSYKL